MIYKIAWDGYAYEGERMVEFGSLKPFKGKKINGIKTFKREARVEVVGIDPDVPESFELPLLEQLLSGRKFVITLQEVKAHKKSFVRSSRERALDYSVEYEVHDWYDVKQGLCKGTRMSLIGGSFRLPEAVRLTN